MTDLEHLKWIYERMVEVHGENINVDYMRRFRKILNDMDAKSFTHVLVPIKATEKMIEAGEEFEYFESGYGSSCEDFYDAMIAVAKEENKND